MADIAGAVRHPRDLPVVRDVGHHRHGIFVVSLLDLRTDTSHENTNKSGQAR
jgi:hypothetical protein